MVALARLDANENAFARQEIAEQVYSDVYIHWLDEFDEMEKNANADAAALLQLGPEHAKSAHPSRKPECNVRQAARP